MKKIFFMMCVAIAMTSCGNNNGSSNNQAGYETEQVTVTDIQWVKEPNEVKYKVLTLSDGRSFELVETRILGYDGEDINVSPTTRTMYFSLDASQVGDTLTKVCQKNAYYYAEGLECPQRPVFTVVERVLVSGAMCYRLSNGATVMISPKNGGYVVNHDLSHDWPSRKEEKMMISSFKTAQVGTKAICHGEYFYTAEN